MLRRVFWRWRPRTVERISRDADRTDVFQDRNLQRILEQISDTLVPQVVVVLVEVFVFSQDRVPVFDRRQ